MHSHVIRASYISQNNDYGFCFQSEELQHVNCNKIVLVAAGVYRSGMFTSSML